MTALQVHELFKEIQTSSKLQKAKVEFSVPFISGGSTLFVPFTKATFAFSPDYVTIFTNEEVDYGVCIRMDYNRFSTAHPSRDWEMLFGGKELDNMVSNINLMYDELSNRKLEIIEILTKDYGQDVADIKQNIKNSEKQISDIETHVFELPDKV